VIVDQLRLPILLAPLAGGPSTARLVAEASGADAFGFLAAGYLTAQRLAEQLVELRSLTARSFGVKQGGRFSAAEAEEFRRRPYADDAVRLRRYDDLAKVLRQDTPPLEHYRAVLEAVIRL
jgi:NAD(P)H-dependent flavin oxidoreductase YrpB (nitropropane dioxygenase family)